MSINSIIYNPEILEELKVALNITPTPPPPETIYPVRNVFNSTVAPLTLSNQNGVSTAGISKTFTSDISGVMTAVFCFQMQNVANNGGVLFVSPTSNVGVIDAIDCLLHYPAYDAYNNVYYGTLTARMDTLPNTTYTIQLNFSNLFANTDVANPRIVLIQTVSIDYNLHHTLT
jgi:hypothetical protein